MRIGVSRRVPEDEAQRIIDAYINNSKSNPYLLPNATLLASGPAAQGAADGGVVMHNLARLGAGLRGEYLAPTLDVEDSSGQYKDSEALTGVEYTKKTTTEERGKRSKTPGPDVDAMWEDAQDLDSYQREQSVEAGEIGARQAGKTVVDPHATNVLATTGNSSSQSQVPSSCQQAKIDKEARKLAKKQRIKAAKKTAQHVKNND